MNNQIENFYLTLNPQNLSDLKTLHENLKIIHLKNVEELLKLTEMIEHVKLHPNVFILIVEAVKSFDESKIEEFCLKFVKSQILLIQFVDENETKNFFNDKENFLSFQPEARVELSELQSDIQNEFGTIIFMIIIYMLDFPKMILSAGNLMKFYEFFKSAGLTFDELLKLAFKSEEIFVVKLLTIFKDITTKLLVHCIAIDNFELFYEFLNLKFEEIKSEEKTLKIDDLNFQNVSTRPHFKSTKIRLEILPKVQEILVQKSLESEEIFTLSVAHKNKEIFKFLLKHQKSRENLEKAFEIALKKEFFHFLSDLIEAANFENFQDVKKTLKVVKNFHKAVEDKNFETLTDLIKKNPKLKIIYGLDGVCLLEKSIDVKNFKAFAFLRSKGFYSDDGEALDNKIENLTEKSKNELQDQILSHVIEDSECFIGIFLSKCTFDCQSADLNFSVIRQMLLEIVEQPDLKALVNFVSDSEFRAVFDLKNEGVNKMSPKVSESARGSYQAKKATLFIAKNFDEISRKATLAHELAHHAMNKLYENDCKPYRVGDDERDKIFNKIVENYHQIYEQNFEYHHEIVRWVFENYQQKSFAVELIVRVPHLLAQYKNNENELKVIREKYRELFEFYYEFIQPDLEIKFGIQLRNLNKEFKVVERMKKIKIEVGDEFECQKLHEALGVQSSQKASNLKSSKEAFEKFQKASNLKSSKKAFEKFKKALNLKSSKEAFENSQKASNLKSSNEAFENLQKASNLKSPKEAFENLNFESSNESSQRTSSLENFEKASQSSRQALNFQTLKEASKLTPNLEASKSSLKAPFKPFRCIIKTNLVNLTLHTIFSMLSQSDKNFTNFISQNIFVDLKALNSQNLLKKEFFAHQKCETVKRVIIDASDFKSANDLREFNGKYRSDVSYIFVTNHWLSLLEEFCSRRNFETFEIEHVWSDLSECSKETILRSEISLQGKKVQLSKVISYKDASKVIRGNFFELLCEFEEIRVNFYEKPREDFIARKFQKKLKTDAEIKSPLLIINELIEKTSSDLKVIISDFAGSGKTFAMKALQAELVDANEDRWISFISLIELLDALSHFKKDTNPQSFLINKILRLKSFSEILIFNHLYETNRMTLIFDGFDEVCPLKNLKENVIKMLSAIPVQVFVTTRCHFEKDLEKALGAFSYRLIAFDRAQQIEFLKIVWMSSKKSFDCGFKVLEKSLKLKESSDDAKACKKLNKSFGNFEDFKTTGKRFESSTKFGKLFESSNVGEKLSGNFEDENSEKLSINVKSSRNIENSKNLSESSEAFEKLPKSSEALGKLPESSNLQLNLSKAPQIPQSSLHPETFGESSSETLKVLEALLQKLQKLISSSKFIGLPLLIKIIAEIGKAKDFKSFTDDFSAFEIFEQYITCKSIIWSTMKGEIGHASSVNGHMTSLNFLQIHQYFALLLSSICDGEDLFGIYFWDDEEWNVEEIIRAGIIYMDSGKNLKFIHETSMEFLVAKFVKRNLAKMRPRWKYNFEFVEFFIKIFICEKFTIVRTFLNDEILKVGESSMEILSENFEKVLGSKFELLKLCSGEGLVDCCLFLIELMNIKKPSKLFVKVATFQDELGENFLMKLLESQTKIDQGPRDVEIYKIIKVIAKVFAYLPQKEISKFFLQGDAEGRTLLNFLASDCIAFEIFEHFWKFVELNLTNSEIKFFLNKSKTFTFLHVTASESKNVKKVLKVVEIYEKFFSVFELKKIIKENFLFHQMFEQTRESFETLTKFIFKTFNELSDQKNLIEIENEKARNIFQISCSRCELSIVKFLWGEICKILPVFELSNYLTKKDKNGQGKALSSSVLNKDPEILKFLWKTAESLKIDTKLFLTEVDNKNLDLFGLVLLRGNFSNLTFIWHQTLELLGRDEILKILKSRGAILNRNILLKVVGNQREFSIVKFLWEAAEKFLSEKEFKELFMERDKRGWNLLSISALKSDSKVLKLNFDQVRKFFTSDDEMKKLLTAKDKMSKNILHLSLENEGDDAENSNFKFVWKVVRKYMKSSEFFEFINEKDLNGKSVLSIVKESDLYFNKKFMREELESLSQRKAR